MKTVHKVPILIIIVVSIIIYLNSIKTPFIYDDNKYIVNNESIKGNISDIFKYGRFLTYLTFKVNYSLGGFYPGGYHLFNIFLHILSGLLIYCFFKKIIEYSSNITDFNLPLIASLFFVCHPVNTEVITYVYNRSASLCTVFYLSSILLFIKFYENKKYIFYVFSIILFILGLLSKELVVTLPIILIIFDYIFVSNNQIREIIKRKYYYLGYLAALFIFIIITKSILFKEIGQEVQDPGMLENYNMYLVKQPWIIAKFIILFFWPVNLSIDYNFHNIGIWDNRTIMSFIFISIILIIGYILYRKKIEGSKIILFSILWFFVALIPTSIFRVHIGERHLYLPIIGLCLLTGYFYNVLSIKLKPRKLNKLITFIILVHLGTLGFATINRNKLYKDPVLIWEDAISKYPDNFRAHNELGLVYYSKKEYEMALKEFEAAVITNPNYVKAYNNLGNMHFYNDFKKAELYYRKAIEIRPTYANAYINLGNLYFFNKMFKDAKIFYQRALELNPNSNDVKYNLEQIYKIQNQNN